MLKNATDKATLDYIEEYANYHLSKFGDKEELLYKE